MAVLPPKFYDPDPGASPDAPVALVLPAMGVPAGAYRHLATTMAALGNPVAVVEWRGTGASPLRAGRSHDWGYLELLEQETLGGLAAAIARWPARPLVMVGHSLGGHIAMMARALKAPGLAAVLLVAAGTPHHRAFSLPIQRKLRTVMLLHKLLSPLVGHYPGQRLGFGGRQPRKLITEWSEFASTGRIKLAGRDPFAARSPAVAQIPVRALVLAQDIYAPRATAAELLRLAGLGDAGINGYDGPGPTGHFDWLKEPLHLAQRITAEMTELVRHRG